MPRCPTAPLREQRYRSYGIPITWRIKKTVLRHVRLYRRTLGIEAIEKLCLRTSKGVFFGFSDTPVLNAVVDRNNFICPLQPMFMGGMRIKHRWLDDASKCTECCRWKPKNCFRAAQRYLGQYRIHVCIGCKEKERRQKQKENRRYARMVKLKKSTRVGKFYVYVLIDPKTRKPFYVGKGTGSRVFAHWKEVCKGRPGCNMKKRAWLEKLLKAGVEPIHRIIDHFDDEQEALRAERELICRLPGLTNAH